MLNFKDWMKISGDEKTSTLQHEKGHIMTIAHDALPKIQMEQLKRLKMSEGGQVKGVHKSDAKKDDENNAGTSKAGVYAKAGKEYKEPVAKKFWNNAAKEEHTRVLGEIRSGQKQDRQYLAEGGEADQSTSDGSQQQDQPQPDTSVQVPGSHDTHITINAAPSPQVGAPVSQPTFQQANVPQVPVPEVKPAAAPSGPLSSNPLVRSAQETMGASEQQQKAAQEQVPISQAASQQAVTNEGQYIDARQRIANMDAEHLADVQKHTSEFADYLTKHPIRPNAYLEDLNAGQKTTTALGLLLGGFGQGLKGGSNPAMDYLNAQTDRNISAQKANADQQKTIWGAYNEMYHNENVATALAKVSANDILTHQAVLSAARLGTPQAQQAANALGAQKKLENAQLLRETAGILTAHGIQSAGAAHQMSPPRKQMGSSGSHGASGDFMTGASADEGAAPQPAPSQRLLGPNAESAYRMLKYDPTKTPQQVSDITDQYNSAIQTDKALDEIDKLYPELTGKATWGGYLANKVDPNAIGGIAAAGAEAAGAMGAIPTAGTSLLGAIPGAIAAGGAGKALGSGVKQGLRALGGQQETQYETAKASLVGYIGSALAGAKVTPSEIEDLAEKFTPTKVDSEATAKDKLNKLKEKIIALSHTSALDAAGMTSKKRR